MRERVHKLALILLIPVLLFGIFIGGLMTWHHDSQLYSAAERAEGLMGCEESATVNCDAVNTSEYAELLGVPIATLAIPFYACMLLVTVLTLRKRPGAGALLLAGGGGAVLYAVFLFIISKTQLGFVCAWCLRSYAVNLAILVAALLGGRPQRPDRATLLTVGATGLGLLLLAVGGERWYRGQLAGGELVELVERQPQEGIERDPQGDAPELAISVISEEKNERILHVRADDAWWGDPQAEVQVVMFSDLECGYCKRMASEVRKLRHHYGDHVLFVDKQFAMDPSCNPGVKNRKHRKACLASRAAVCAKRQGRYWAFHDLAFKNQHQLGKEYLQRYAEEVELDMAAWRQCMGSPDAAAEVRADGEDGAAVDIHGTPRVFIDGRLYRSGTSASVMARVIELALGADKAQARRSAAAMKTDIAAIEPIPDDAPSARQLRFGELAFSMDSFEASLDGERAVSGKHRIPALHVSWHQAAQACQAAGKRLCSEREWISACQGTLAVDDNQNGEYADDMIEGTAYPYGDFHVRGRCWDARDREKERPVYTGELPGCATAEGIYDLTGNMEEWVGTTPEEAVLLGGAWDTGKDHARCYRRNDTYGAGYASVRTGFRCCADAAE